MISPDDLKRLRASLNERNMYLRKSRGAWMGYECGPKERGCNDVFLYPQRWVDTAEDVEKYIQDADAEKASYEKEVA